MPKKWYNKDNYQLYVKGDFEMKKDLFSLFLTFMKIGAFTFGGGYAMIPLIQKETVEKHNWISDEDILDIIAIAESTPGPIAINSATFVGYKVAGFWGSFFATIGMVIPSFVIIYIISKILKGFEDIAVVQYAFWGIRAGVLSLVIKALWSMYTKCPKNTVSYVVAIFSFAAVAFFGVNVLIVIICCALIGVITSVWASKKIKTEKGDK